MQPGGKVTMTLPSNPNHNPPFTFERVKHAYVLENPCVCRTADIRYPFQIAAIMDLL